MTMVTSLTMKIQHNVKNFGTIKHINMPVIKCANGNEFEKFTALDKFGRLRSYVKYFCQSCNSIDVQRIDEYNRKGLYCKKCKIKNNSISKLKNRDLELVCATIYLSRIKKRYLKKGLTTNLNPKEVLKLIKQNCHYCNYGLSNKFIYKQPHFVYEFEYNGLDRIDSKIGYIKGNVLPCCKTCNIAKSDLTYHDFINHIKIIYNNLCQ